MIDIPAVSKAAIDGLYLIALPVVLAALAFVVHARIGGGLAAKTRWLVAVRGLSFTSAAHAQSWRRFLAGTMVPFMAASALIVALAIEREVRDGPNRTIDTLAGSVDDTGNLYWILQRGTGHLMNDSRLDQTTVDQIMTAAPTSPGIEGVQPFYAQLALLEHAGRSITGFVFAAEGPDGVPSVLSPTTDSGHCVLIERRCRLADNEVIVDSGDGVAIGDELQVRGRAFTVVGHSDEPRSLLNRTVVFAGMDGYRRVTGTDQPDGYGLLVSAQNIQAAQQLVSAAGAAETTEILSTQALREENSRFWTGNGTLLVLLLVLIIVGFAAAALYAGRRAEQERSIVTQGVLRALAITPRGSTHVDLLRALLTTLKAVPPAVPVALAFVYIANFAIIGFRAAVSVQMVLAAAALLVLSSGLAGGVAARRFARSAPVDLLNERGALPAAGGRGARSRNGQRSLSRHSVQERTTN